jgi:hypothetical protein
MYLLWVSLGRYIIIPPKGTLEIIASSDCGDSQGAGVKEVSWISTGSGSIAGDGFFIEEKSGGFFTCFHNGLHFWL